MVFARSVVCRGWNSLESGSNKWSKNQDLCTFIIKFSQRVCDYFLFFANENATILLLWQMIHFFGHNNERVCRLQLFVPLLWHLHFDCFVVLCFLFCILLCISPSHEFRPRSSHVIKTNIECIPRLDASALRYCDMSARAHTFFVRSSSVDRSFPLNQHIQHQI